MSNLGQRSVRRGTRQHSEEKKTVHLKRQMTCDV